MTQNNEIVLGLVSSQILFIQCQCRVGLDHTFDLDLLDSMKYPMSKQRQRERETEGGVGEGGREGGRDRQ